MKPVLGLDLSLTGTGVAVITQGRLPEVTVIRSKPLGATIRDRSARVLKIKESIMAFADDHGFHRNDALVVIEQPAYAQVAGSQHDRSGLWWSVVHEYLSMAQVTEVPPTVLKKYATGRGSASKEEVLWRTAKEWTSAEVIDDNGADALWLAAMGMAHQDPDLAGHNVTAGRKLALKSVAWAH